MLSDEGTKPGDDSGDARNGGPQRCCCEGRVACESSRAIVITRESTDECQNCENPYKFSELTPYLLSHSTQLQVNKFLGDMPLYVSFRILEIRRL